MHRFWHALAGTALPILALDQITKAWVLTRAEELAASRPAYGLTLLWNEAVAFSLPIRGAWVYLSSGLILLIVVPTLIRSLDRTRTAGGILIGLLLGGAAGNLVDRVRFGAVIDFVKLGSWPVFNVADAAISTAVATLLVFGSRLSRRDAPAVTELGFNEALVPLVVSGERTVTIRANPAYASLRPGMELSAVHTQVDRRFGTLTLTSVETTTLGRVALPMPGYGHQTTEDLREELQRYYQAPVTDDAVLRVIGFALTAVDPHALAALGLSSIQDPRSTI